MGRRGDTKSKNDGRSKSGRGGGGGVREPLPRSVLVSKALSFLLRHGAKAEGVELDDGGWANVADVVSLECSEQLYGFYKPFYFGKYRDNGMVSCFGSNWCRALRGFKEYDTRLSRLGLPLRLFLSRVISQSCDRAMYSQKGRQVSSVSSLLFWVICLPLCFSFPSSQE